MRRQIAVTGKLMGRKLSRDREVVQEDVVLVTRKRNSRGPAENSIIVIQALHSGAKKGKYLSWIGYGDLDIAKKSEPRVWKLFEPPKDYSAKCFWSPFG